MHGGVCETFTLILIQKYVPDVNGVLGCHSWCFWKRQQQQWKQ